jgi:phage FluMu protein Com
MKPKFATSYITLVLYHQLIPKSTGYNEELQTIRCLHCGKFLGKILGRVLTVSNTRSPGPKELPVGLAAFELKCPTCNTVYSLLWQ